MRYEVASVTILLPSRRTALSPTTARAGRASLGFEIAFDMDCVDLKYWKSETTVGTEVMFQTKSQPRLAFKVSLGSWSKDSVRVAIIHVKI